MLAYPPSAAEASEPITLPRSLDAIPDVGSQKGQELVALDDALHELAKIAPRKARVIELRFFGGLSVEETAQVLNLSPQSILRDWKLGKAWLQREIAR